MTTDRDGPLVQTVRPVLRFSCDGCPEWQPELDGTYMWQDIRDTVMRAHETGLPS
jgi:hypothetical protein